MTDIHEWPDLIRKDKLPAHSHFGNTGVYCLGCIGGAEYVMLPFNEYQMGNLLAYFYGQWNATDTGMHPELNIGTGDWWQEIPNVIACAMWKLDIKEVHSNNGLTFVLKRFNVSQEEPLGRWEIWVGKSGEEAVPWL
jgi:hypothetical protein